MSEFSEKCRKHILDMGSNVYQMSQATGLDRTTLQRMITGKRLPGSEFVSKFINCLRINSLEKEELTELYKIAKIGRPAYENRRCIRNLLEYLPSIDNPDGFSAFDHNAYASRSSFSVTLEIEAYKLLKRAAQHPGSAQLNTNLPPNCSTLFSIIQKLELQENLTLAVRHLFPLYQNPAACTNANINLEILYDIFPFALSGYTDYQPRYYYSKITAFDYGMQLYPYYMITPQGMLSIDTNLSSFVFLDDHRMLSSYLKTFEQTFDQSTPLLEYIKTPGKVLDKYESFLNIHGVPCYSLEAHPCLLSMMYSPELLDVLYPDPVFPNRDKLIKILCAAQENLLNSKHIYVNYFTESGMERFLQTGTLAGQLSIGSKPLPAQYRHKAMNYFLQNESKQYVPYMLKKDSPISPDIHIELFKDYSMIFIYLHKDHTFHYIAMDESSIGHAFYDFLDSLSETYMLYTKEEMTAILKDMNRT